MTEQNLNFFLKTQKVSKIDRLTWRAVEELKKTKVVDEEMDSVGRQGPISEHTGSCCSLSLSLSALSLLMRMRIE